ncbi:MAG: hypothetical protein KAR44_05920 [Candidatus Aegiribacteria sp.]|nr:hypothetical protein [Candidatus Aegiribacteria sp.]
MDDILTVFNKVLVDACQRNASDIHLCVGTPWKYRVNGLITSISELPILIPPDTETIVRYIVTLSRNVLTEKLMISYIFSRILTVHTQWQE